MPGAPGADSGGRLVDRIVRHDPDALLGLFRLFGSRLLIEVQQHLGDPDDCEIVLQATMLEVWRLARFHPSTSGDVRDWICGIATRRAIERSRAIAEYPCDALNRVELSEIFASAR